MNKRKADDDLVRFVWKRNINYDLKLLEEVELFDPFAHDNPKVIWDEIAIALQESDLRMKVTDRSCKGRFTDLLNCYRRSDFRKALSPTASMQQTKKVQDFLERISKMEQPKANKKLQKLGAPQQLTSLPTTKNIQQPSTLSFSQNKKRQNKGSDEVKQVRAEIARALENVELESSDDEPEKTKSDDLIDFEFGPSDGSVVKSDSKKELLTYLGKKSVKEIDLKKAEMSLRQEEIRLREKEIENKKNEVEILRFKAEEEIRLRDREMENKKKELEIQQLKAEAEIEERKKMTELLIKLVNTKQ